MPGISSIPSLGAPIGAFAVPLSLASLPPPLRNDREVHVVAFSPSGKVLLTGSGNAYAGAGDARLWDASTGKLLYAPLVHRGAVVAAAFSPDGRMIVTGCKKEHFSMKPKEKPDLGDEARLFRVADGRPVGRPLPHQAGVEAVAFSPDSKTVLTGSSDNTGNHSGQAWSTEGRSNRPGSAPRGGLSSS